MAFEKYLENLTRDFTTLEKYLEQRKSKKQKV